MRLYPGGGMRFTFSHREDTVLRRGNLDEALVVFLWTWRHPITGNGGVVVTDTGSSEFQFLGCRPAYLGVYDNDDAFWELAQAHAHMQRAGVTA